MSADQQPDRCDCTVCASQHTECPYCEGSGDGELHPGANVHEPCQTCGGTGEIHVDDARSLRENSARYLAPASDDQQEPTT